MQENITLNQNNPYTSNPNNFYPYTRGNRYRPGSWATPTRRTRGPRGFLLLLALIVLLAGGGFFLNHLPDYTPPTFLEQLPDKLPLLPLILAIGGTLLLLILLGRIFQRTPLGNMIGRLLVALIFVIVIGVFGWLFFINPYVGMTKTGFIRNSVSISNGSVLHLQNSSDGVTQTLCIGVDQKCQHEDGAPSSLQHSIRVQPGQTLDISFPTDGTYHITSENTPGMNMTVSVTTPDDGNDD
jgi:hypothetical protein